MEDKGLDFSKPPPEPENPPVNRSVPRCFLLRESGFKNKTNTVAKELQWAAEDKMVMRSHEEFRCQLPDVSRSTFLMVFSPDGKKVASTHGNHNVYVTDLTSGKNIKTLTGHPRTPWCIAFHPSSNHILASGCLGGQVRVWDLSGGSEIWMAESQTVIASLAFHPIDRMLVIASYNELHFWDWSQPEPFAKCFTSNEKEKVRYVAFDALGHKLITGVANAPTRPPSQWDRVAAPQPPPQTSQLDSERRITICYRYMVEQYEQLVQRYCDLSRARSTLTMDRGTDPMEFEGESSDSQSTTQNVPRSSRLRGNESSRRVSFCPTARPRLSSGTDEASASHSSTNFLSPPEPSQNEDVTQPLLPSSSDASLDSATPENSRPDTPRRNPRFDILLPSFVNFRSRSSSVPSTYTGADPPSTFTPQTSQSTESPQPNPLLRLSLSPESIGFGLNRSDSSVTQSNQSETPPHPPETPTRTGGSGSSVHQLLRNLSSWCNRSNPSDGTSTEVNSGVDSENEEPEGFQGFQPESQSEDEPQSRSYIRYMPLSGNNTASRNPRNSEGSSARRSLEASAVSQLRSQFHQLQSVYENRNSAYSSHAHVFSPETQAAERRLLNRLNEILERPLPEPRARRLSASRRSAFQPRPQPPPTTPSTSTGSVTAASPDIIGGVRYGIQLLSRHIDNMQRLCRARLEILQLQQIRRMWEDLQSQIYALHGAVRTEEGGSTQPEQPPATLTTATTTTNATSTVTTATATNTNNLLTDDDSDGPSNNGDVFWRLRRTPQTSRRNVVKPLPRTLNRNPPMKRSRLMFRTNDYSRRLTLLQMEAHRRQLNRQQQASSSTQATSEDRGDASSSQVSSESTGTSDERVSVRGVKRKSRDSDPLFRPRPSQQGSTSSSAGTSTSSLAAVLRETIVQLENMVWRHRQGSSQRNTRLSRFTRQREERMMRNLWDTESSHESSRDDQSEGDSSQQSAPGEFYGGESEWTRDSTRMRARQVLLLMVDSLTQFFENDNLTRRTTNEALNDRIHNLYILLQLALNLTDLLLAQLVHSRRELEARRPGMLESNWGPARQALRSARYARHTAIRNMRRLMRRAAPHNTTSPSTSPTPTRSSPSPPPGPAPPSTATNVTPSVHSRPFNRHPVSMYQSIRSAMFSQSRPPPVVPIVRVNDLPAPPPEALPVPRFRPHSPPLMGLQPMFVPPRFLHPGRYAGSGFVFDESTSEDSSPQDRSSSDFFFMRAGYGSSSVILTDTPLSPHHRIQAWDFSKYKLPDLGNAEKNVVVGECKIHNDASVDMSKDGSLLVTLLPSGRLSMTTHLGIYSLQWNTLGQMLYTTSFEQSIVSVSLSPTTRHLVVGLASRRVALVSADRHTNARVFRLEGASPGRKSPLGPRGRLVHLRDLELSRHLGFMSLNCIRWAPNPGQGLVYGTNTGHLKILR
uniref:Uncharacterized protein n=1 Tax=Cuerna arida TaxID=1464854 RepID=A0A1B6FRC8_9HEMI